MKSSVACLCTGEQYFRSELLFAGSGDIMGSMKTVCNNRGVLSRLHFEFELEFKFKLNLNLELELTLEL